MSAEKFYGYCFDAEERYGAPVVLQTAEEIGIFLSNNVECHHELRLVDADDNIVLQVKDQTLLHPLTGDMSPNNKWNPQRKKFVAI